MAEKVSGPAQLIHQILEHAEPNTDLTDQEQRLSVFLGPTFPGGWMQIDNGPPQLFSLLPNLDPYLLGVRHLNGQGIAVQVHHYTDGRVSVGLIPKGYQPVWEVEDENPLLALSGAIVKMVEDRCERPAVH